MRHTPQNEAGFSLIEVTVGMLLLMIGSLALAGGVAAGARRLTGSQDQLLASQRAAEAAESVFKARDNRTITWAQVRNVVGLGADGGIFGACSYASCGRVANVIPVDAVVPGCPPPPIEILRGILAAVRSKAQ